MTELKKIRSYSLKLLGRREYSSEKLRTKLLTVGYLLEEIEDTIIWLKSNNFLCDERYKIAKIRELVRAKKSPQFIAQKLRFEGLSLTHDEVMEQFLDLGFEVENILNHHLEKKLRSTESLTDPKAVSKILNSLSSKGFKHQDIMRQIQLKRTQLRQNENDWLLED